MNTVSSAKTYDSMQIAILSSKFQCLDFTKTNTCVSKPVTAL